MRKRPVSVGLVALLAAVGFRAGGEPARQHSADRLWPSGRAGHVMAYDAARGETVLLGGDTDLVTQTEDSVWAWTGSEWRVQAAPGPGWRTLPALAFDARRGRLVLAGGMRIHGFRRYGDVAEADTWERAGDGWERRDVGSPGPLDHHAMVYDGARGVMVIQGGADGSRIVAGATWTYDGERWTLAADSAAGPGPRVHHAMAYDSRRERVVLFGGSGTAGPPDVWEWDGARWHRISAPGPGPRSRHRMAYDAARGVTVLHGGNEDASTWTWDGTAWRVAALDGPPARQLAAMAYDSRRERVVLYGGNERQSDLWEWDGTRWEEVRR